MRPFRPGPGWEIAVDAAASGQKRILIVRLSAIGDTIHSLPLAAALKKSCPGCHIGWVVEQPSAALIAGNPLIDWYEVLPKGWLKSPARAWELRRVLRAQKFDIAIDPQGLTKSAVVAWLSGAKKRIGFSRGESRELAPLLDNVLVPPKGRHAVDMTLSLLSALDIPVPDVPEFVFPDCPEEDRRRIDDFLSRPVYAGGFVLMGPWGSFAAKLWPLERFLELAVALKRETGLPSVMLGHGRQEREAAHALADRSDGALAVAPDVTLTGVVGLARRAGLFVGCDSFPMHAAAGVGCRTLGLFGVTDPERLGPYGPRGATAQDRITLVKSTRERRKLDPDTMRALQVETVFAACCRMLAE